MKKNLEKETGKTEIHVVIPEKDNEGYFVAFPEIGVRLPAKNYEGLITGYYRPKKENN